MIPQPFPLGTSSYFTEDKYCLFPRSRESGTSSNRRLSEQMMPTPASQPRLPLTSLLLPLLLGLSGEHRQAGPEFGRGTISPLATG